MRIKWILKARACVVESKIRKSERYFIILPGLLVGYGHQNYTWDSCRRYSNGSLPFWSNRHGLLQRSDKEGLTARACEDKIIAHTHKWVS